MITEVEAGRLNEYAKENGIKNPWQTWILIRKTCEDPIWKDPIWKQVDGPIKEDKEHAED